MSEEREKRVTWTMATRRRTPLRPTAMEATAITAGPVRNLTAIEKAAMLFPHAMILGCNAMNKPVILNTPFFSLKKNYLLLLLLKQLSSSLPPPPPTHINQNPEKERNLQTFASFMLCFAFSFCFPSFLNKRKWMLRRALPRLNMAIPSPASDSIEMDFAIMAGISTFHLHVKI